MKTRYERLVLAAALCAVFAVGCGKKEPEPVSEPSSEAAEESPAMRELLAYAAEVEGRHAAQQMAREAGNPAAPAVPREVAGVFAKAKESADDGNVDFCGFYVGMSRADFDTLAAHYGLKDGEWTVEGDPVYKIRLSLKSIRRVTKKGNTFDELTQAVADHVGDLKLDWETKDYGLKTIDGVSVTMSESSGLDMVDTDANAAAERKAREATGFASVSISDAVAIELRSVPGPLWFGKTEVTQSQWEAVMGDNPSYSKNPSNPVEQVSWDDCQKFLKKLNALPFVKKSGLTFRLPTEEEWKRACRAGATGDYCRLADGTEITESNLGQVAWFDDNSDNTTHPVGQKQPNAFGLYDMLGNVEELTSTVAAGYYTKRIARGGSYWNKGGRLKSGRLESHLLDHYSPSERVLTCGFRLCAEEAE